MCPTPNWSLCLIEIYEEPGFIDDGFRTGWTALAMANEPTDKHFWTTWDIVGDVAEMYVKESASSQGAGYRKDISAKNLSTTTYPIVRTRLKGADTQPYYKIKVVYTDDSSTDTGWISAATDAYFVKSVELASGKTVKYVELYVKSGGGSGAEAKIWWDYVAVLKNPPLAPHEVEELDVDLQTTIAVSGFKFKVLNDPLFASQVLRLPLDENFGTKAYDLSRYKNHGSIYGASWVDGKFGKALSFDGVNDYVRIEDSPSLNITGLFSIHCWIKGTFNPSGENRIYDKELGESGITLDVRNGKLECWVGDGAEWVYAVGTSLLQNNTWYFVTATYDGTNIRLFVNGIEEGTHPIQSAPGSTAGQFAVLGCNVGISVVWYNGIIDEVHIYNRALTPDEIIQLYQSSPRSGIARAGVGDVAMIYVAAEGESLDQKLVKGRISERESVGEPDNPLIAFSGEDYGRILQDRTFTKEYATPTQPSQILKDAIDQEAPELTRASIEDTDNAVKPRYNEQNIHALARDYAEACKNGSGVRGFDLWVDPGDDLRFKTLCAYTCPHRLSDGSDGHPKNILAIRVRDSYEGLANSVKVIIFEEEYEPKDRDSYTENKERWTVIGAVGSSMAEDSDCKRGSRSIKAIIVSGSASGGMTLGNDNSLYIDMTQAEKIKLWMKSDLQNVNPSTIEILMYTDKSDINSYHKLLGEGFPASWTEKEYVLSDFAKTGNPGKIITKIKIYCEPNAGYSLSGNLWVDGLHFVLPEKAKTSEDSTSISKYGKRKKRYVRKEVTDEDYTQYLATNLCQLNKNPTTNISATILGKAQPGYRPPQKIIVTSLKDGINQKDFRITRARHHYILGSYTCEMDLIAAKTDIDTYEPKILSREIVDIGMAVTILHKRQEEASMGTIRGEWKS